MELFALFLDPISLLYGNKMNKESMQEDANILVAHLLNRICHKDTFVYSKYLARLFA